MKYIKIFIASSIVEFERERIFIGDHIRRINDNFEENGYYVKLYLCETDALNLQSTYNRRIKECDIFISLVGIKLGEKTKEELYVASDSEKIAVRCILGGSEDNLSNISNDLLNKFTVKIIPSFNIKELLGFIDSSITQVLDDIGDLPYSPINKSFVLSLPDYQESYEIALISNIIRSAADRFENEVRVIVSNTQNEEYNAYVSLLSEDIKAEELKLSRMLNRLETVDSIWLFYNLCKSGHLSDDLIKNLYNQGNYAFPYTSLKDLKAKFKDKLFDTLLEFKSFRKTIYKVENHILYEESEFTNRRTQIANLISLEFNPILQKRLEDSIVNILNSYAIKGNHNKLKESLIKLESSNFDYFILNNDVVNPDLPIKQYYNSTIEYIYNSIEFLNYKTNEYSSEEILTNLIQVLNITIENNIRLNAEDEFIIFYLSGNLLSLYSDKNDISKEYYVKAYDAYNAISDVEKKYYYIPNVKNLILNICEIFYNDNDIIQLNKWIDNGKKNYDNDTICKAKLSVYEARANRGRNDVLAASKAYDNALELLSRGDLYKSEDSYLDLYIIIYVEKVFFEYSNNDKEGIDLECLKYEIKELDILSQNYLRYYDYGLSKIYILYVKGWLHKNIEFFNNADSLLDSYINISKNQEWYYDLLYIKSLSYREIGEVKESNKLLLEIVDKYNGKVNQASCYQNIGTNFSYMIDSVENLDLAIEAYKKALELNPNFEGKIYDGISFCHLMKKDFKEAELYALKALKADCLLDDNKYANYITALLCQRKYVKAFYIYFIKCKSKRKIKDQLEKDWENDIQQMGVDTSKFSKIFMFDKLRIWRLYFYK